MPWINYKKNHRERDVPHLTVPVNEKDHIQGSTDASITLVEYGDYQCFVCRMAHPIIKQISAELEHPFRFVFRNFPLRQTHPYAQMAAEAAEAAGLQNKFWEMHDLLYFKQLLLAPELLTQLAKDLQLNVEQFQADMQSSDILRKIQEDFNTGVRSGVNGTPCFYINGERYDGDLSYDSFKQALQDSKRP